MDLFELAVANKLAGGGGGGGHDVEDGIIQRTITSYFNSTASLLGVYAFMGCYSLSTIEMTSATNLSNSVFTSCSALTTASFPNAKSIGYYAFSGCKSLTSVYLPIASAIGQSAFYYCITLPSIELPAAKNIEKAAFGYCSALSLVSLGKSTISHNTVFFYQSVFYNCKGLKSVYILSNAVATLSNADAFYNTPMQYSSYLGYFGSIYVPASLVDSYKASTNWSVYKDRITSYVE